MEYPRNIEDFKKWAQSNLGTAVFLQYENRKAVHKILRIARVNSSAIYLEDESGQKIRIAYPKKGHYQFLNDSFRLVTRDFKYDLSGPKRWQHKKIIAAQEEVADDPGINISVESLLSMYPASHAFTEREKAILRNYRSLSQVYQKPAFHLPPGVLTRMWDLAYQFGFSGEGNVLDPSAGIGSLLEAAPDKTIRAAAYEADLTASRILRILCPWVKISVAQFSDAIKSSIDLKTKKITSFPGLPFDLLIGIPPLGSWTGIGDMVEILQTNANSVSEYYLTRGLDLLKTGGILVFLLRKESLSGDKTFLETGLSNCRRIINAKADLLEAFHLPRVKVDAESVACDLVVFRKK